MKMNNILSLVQILILCTIAFCLAIHPSNPVFKKNWSAAEHIHEAEVKYMSYLSELTDEVQSYIDKKSPSSNLHALGVIELCTEYGVDLKFVLAQGQKESNFGVAGIAAVTNSVWNVGAYDGLDSSGISKKYHYKHPNESLEPYLKLLKARYLIGKTEHDLLINYVDKDGKRYASSETYESSLMSIYDTIAQETRIDELQSMLRHYKIECGR